MVLARAPATPLLPLTAAVEPLPVRLVNPTDAVAAEEDAERRRELKVLSLLALLVQKYKYRSRGGGGRGAPARTQGTQFTCFTGTKVQILT
jgi:hypothetical protein